MRNPRPPRMRSSSFSSASASPLLSVASLAFCILCFASVLNATKTSLVFFYTTPIPGLSSIPYIGPILFGYGFSVYLAIILAICMGIFLKKTRIGLNLRSVGESPASSDAVGINVTGYKYIATTIGCALCGLSGVMYVLGYGGGLWS